MNYRIEFADGLMMLLDEDGNGHDACEIDVARPTAAHDALAGWIRNFDVDPDAIDELEQYLAACR
jgi:hypothetical protein